MSNLKTIISGIIARKKGVTFYSSKVVESQGLSTVECRYTDNGVPCLAKSFATAAWIRRELTEVPVSYDTIEDVAVVTKLDDLADLTRKPWSTAEDIDKQVELFSKLGLVYCKQRYTHLADYIWAVKGIFVPEPMLLVTLARDYHGVPKFLGSISVVPGHSVKTVVEADPQLRLLLANNRGVNNERLQSVENLRLPASAE